MPTKPPVWPYKKEEDEVPSNVKSSDYKDYKKDYIGDKKEKE